MGSGLCATLRRPERGHANYRSFRRQCKKLEHLAHLIGEIAVSIIVPIAWRTPPSAPGLNRRKAVTGKPRYKLRDFFSYFFLKCLPFALDRCTTVPLAPHQRTPKLRAKGAHSCLRPSQRGHTESRIRRHPTMDRHEGVRLPSGGSAVFRPHSYPVITCRGRTHLRSQLTSRGNRTYIAHLHVTMDSHVLDDERRDNFTAFYVTDWPCAMLAPIPILPFRRTRCQIAS